MAMFCSAKAKIKTAQKTYIIYDIQCRACKEHYIGKTDQCFVTRHDEHGSRHDQPIFQHLVNCKQFLEELSILNLPISGNIPELELNSHIMNAVHNNLKVLDYNNSWYQLCFLEAFFIKTLKPKINAGLKGALSRLRQFLITESPLKIMKNDFYFIFKALFILKMFKFFSRIFDRADKTARLER